MNSDGIWFLPDSLPMLDDDNDVSLRVPNLPFRGVALPPKPIDYSRPLPSPPAGYEWKLIGKHWQCKEITKEEPTPDGVSFPEEKWLEHVVMSDDTIQGICLRYRTSVLELRRNNNFSGDAFRSCKVLRIRVNADSIVLPQEETEAVKIRRLQYMTDLGHEECRYYMSENGWSLVDSLNAWQSDFTWEDDLCNNAVSCRFQSTCVVPPDTIITGYNADHLVNSRELNYQAKPLLGKDPIKYILV